MVQGMGHRHAAPRLQVGIEHDGWVQGRVQGGTSATPRWVGSLQFHVNVGLVGGTAFT